MPVTPLPIAVISLPADDACPRGWRGSAGPATGGLMPNPSWVSSCVQDLDAGPESLGMVIEHPMFRALRENSEPAPAAPALDWGTFPLMLCPYRQISLGSSIDLVKLALVWQIACHFESPPC